jgi:hypothetical protein
MLLSIVYLLVCIGMLEQTSDENQKSTLQTIKSRNLLLFCDVRISNYTQHEKKTHLNVRLIRHWWQSSLHSSLE